MTKLQTILLIAFAAAFAMACGPKVPEKESVPLSASPLSVSMAALGEQQTITLTSSADWYARSSKQWLKLLNASGKASESAQQMAIMAEENKTTEARSAEITISNLNSEQVVISVSQEAGTGESIRRGIYDAQDLVNFAKAVGGEGSIAMYLVDGTAKLMADIDASSIKEWIPIGSAEKPLTYNFDGAGHSINNVNWTVDLAKYPYAGFIGYAKGITVERLTFGSSGSTVELKGSNSTVTQAGGIVGAASATSLERVTNNAFTNRMILHCLQSALALPGIFRDRAEWFDALIRSLADRITFMEMTLFKMDPSVRGYKHLKRSIAQMKDNLAANGYEIVEMLGKPFHEGMKATVSFEDDDTLEPGTRIITNIIKPQINYRGEMIQASQISVSQNI